MSSLSQVDLTKAIGMTVELSFNKSNIKLTGNIMSIIKTSNLIVLVSRGKEKDSNLTSYIINIEQIKSIELSKVQEEIDISELMKIDTNKVEDNEKRNVSKDILIKKI